MKYRSFGRLSWKPSALGFGAMRLPALEFHTNRTTVLNKDALSNPDILDFYGSIKELQED